MENENKKAGLLKAFGLNAQKKLKDDLRLSRIREVEDKQGIKLSSRVNIARLLDIQKAEDLEADENLIVETFFTKSEKAIHNLNI